MDFKKVSFSLGIFSVGLGVAELLCASKISHTLDVPNYKGLVRAFGVREVAAGAALLSFPANATGVWSRVAGDALDLAALGAVAAKSPRNRVVWWALAFVAGATALDLITARGLDRTTGKTWPVRDRARS
jgi:hypothetical protein